MAEPLIGVEFEKLMSQLLNELSKTVQQLSNSLSVYPIVGLGGIGKTTLAKLVFNHYEVSTNFDTKVWVSVSEDFSVKRILCSIIESITSEKCDALDLDVIQRKTKELLHGKRFLLVLDDAWNEELLQEKWNQLKSVLSSGSKGSCCLVSTRNEVVASIMGTCQPHHLSGPFVASSSSTPDNDILPALALSYSHLTPTSIQRRNRDESETESINQIVGIVSRKLHHLRLPNATWQNLSNDDNIWRIVGLVSSVVGLPCYALSPSFNRLIGTKKPFKFIPYGVLSLVLFTIILFAKKSPISTRHDHLKIYMSFAVFIMLQMYTFYYDRAVNGKPDILNVVSNAAFVLVSLSLHKIINFGFEIGVFSYFLGCFAVQLYTINWMLILIAIFFGCPLFVMHSSQNAQPEVLVGSDGQHVVDIDS